MTVSVTLPSRLGEIPQIGLVPIVGVGFGALSGEFAGSAVQTFSKYTGWMGLAVKAIAKLAWSGILLALSAAVAAGRYMSYGAVAAITSAGTIVVDLFNYFYPGGATSAGQMLGLTRGARGTSVTPMITGAPTARQNI